MPFQQKLTRTIANIVYLLKGKALQNANPKFLVFTGTVGKTTLRDTAAFTLQSLDYPVQSNSLGYSNELGVLISAVGLATFSPKSLTDWLKLIAKKVEPNQFICIELGADFYSDIAWFLKKFTPFAVFISGIANQSWSKNISEVFNERKKLLQAVPKYGFIFYNQDSLQTVALVKNIKITGKLESFSLEAASGAKIRLKEWSKNIYTKSLPDAFIAKELITIEANGQNFNLNLSRPIFEPQIYGILAAIGLVSNLLPAESNRSKLVGILENYPFSKNRLQFFETRNKATIIEDSYKATPLCTFWFLEMAKKIKAKIKILVLTEMRPLTFNIEGFYNELGKASTFADHVYFLGPLKYFELLQKNNPKIKHIKTGDYQIVAKEILKDFHTNDLILLKGSFRYRLEDLRKLLI